MGTSPKLHFFSYKSAFLFFGFVFVFNLIFNPLLSIIGVEKQLALFLGNSFAISAGLTLVIVFIEGKFKSKLQMSTLFLSLLIGCLFFCYYIVYR